MNPELVKQDRMKNDAVCNLIVCDQTKRVVPELASAPSDVLKAHRAGDPILQQYIVSNSDRSKSAEPNEPPSWGAADELSGAPAPPHARELNPML